MFPNQLRYRKYLKSQKNTYAFFCMNKNELKYIIKKISEYTQRFLVIDCKEFDSKNLSEERIYSFYIDVDIDNLFGSDPCYNTRIINRDICKFSGYIILAQKIFTDDFYVGLYDFWSLINSKLIAKNFIAVDIMISNGIVVPVYSNYLSVTSYKYNIILTYSGIGDFFTYYSLIEDYIEMSKQNNIQTIIFYSKNNIIQKIISVAFEGEVTVACLESKYLLFTYYGYYKTLKFCNVIEGFLETKMHIGELMHISHIKRLALGINETPYDYFKHTEKLKKKLLKYEDKELMDNLKSDKINIGIQFYTGTDDLLTRSWNEKNVKEFINLCSHEQSIEVFNLAPSIYVMEGTTDVSQYDIKKIANFISKIDIFVGIDSCCAHIAAFFNIPNIVIWGAQTPMDFRFSHINDSFRQMRNNISIISNKRDINEIKARDLFYTLMTFINGGIKIQEIDIDNIKSISNTNIIEV